MEEKTFLNEGGVNVTSARFIVPSQTFAMSGITSVKAFREDPSRVWPVIFLILGVLLMFGGGGAMICGIILASLSVAWLASQKAIFHILLATASGEAKALSSPDRQWIDKVVTALNDSIVHRG